MFFIFISFLILAILVPQTSSNDFDGKAAWLSLQSLTCCCCHPIQLTGGGPGSLVGLQNSAVWHFSFGLKTHDSSMINHTVFHSFTLGVEFYVAVCGEDINPESHSSECFITTFTIDQLFAGTWWGDVSVPHSDAAVICRFCLSNLWRFTATFW